MKEKIADVLTSIRILVSGALLFCPVFSSAFYVLYLVGGLSDMFDGIIARKQTQSVNLDRNLIQPLILYLLPFA